VILESERAVFGLNYSPLEVIVVDNGSTDGSDNVLQEFIAEYARRGMSTKFIRLPRNLGFGAANNIGLSQASPSTKYVALVNSDLAPEKGSLSSFVEYLEKHPEVAGVQGKILSWDGNRIDNAGVYLSTAWYVFPRGIVTPAEIEYPKASVSYLDGAYSVYSIDAIRKVGGLFVEDFFLFGDDFELGARLWRSGFVLKYCDVEAGRHYRGLTLKQLGRKRELPRCNQHNSDFDRDRDRASTNLNASYWTEFRWKGILNQLQRASHEPRLNNNADHTISRDHRPRRILLLRYPTDFSHWQFDWRIPVRLANSINTQRWNIHRQCRTYTR